jgi:hypothetical protein
MGYTKRIVCLANSRKLSGRCLAGREVAGSGFGAWIRPISDRPDHEISEEDRRYEDGTMPRLLDIVDVTMKAARPENHQQENHLIDDGYYWERRGSTSWKSLQAAVEDPDGSLWVNGDSSSYGQNDRVGDEETAALRRSLYLVRPTKLSISVAVEGGGLYPAKRKVRATFELCGHTYCVAVTDPVVESRHLAGPDGDTAVPDALLCVSLGEPFKGHAYKLVAAVITP